MNPQINQSGRTNSYEAGFTSTFLPDEQYESFNLDMPDQRLEQMLVKSLNSNKSHWDKAPWKLEETDVNNTRFFLGEQGSSGNPAVRNESSFVDNRLFSGVRAILSYATGQLAQPELTPSRSDKEYVQMARNLQAALYQHSVDEGAEQKVRAAVLNLVTRKRGYLKQRFDPYAGTYGDIVTEVCNPEDIIIDRHAKYMDNPNVIYHRIRCTVEELCARFPKKESEIKRCYNIVQGRFSQMSQYVTYYEAWFSYMGKGDDGKAAPKEGVAWFVGDPHNLILDKAPNPNWIYTGNDEQDKKTNITPRPPKPFTWFNYINLGHSFIDETCLVEQARPQQEMLNQRGKQFNQNVDYMNGRWIGSKKAFSEEDATKFVNKGPRTLALVNAEDVGKAVQVLTASTMPKEVYQSMEDFRLEIDGILGTPSVFKGANPSSRETLGRDMLVKAQAGMLQDDLVRAVQYGMANYYKTKLQMMRTYYTDDYWFQVKGGDGKFDFIMLNGDLIDSNVKISVKTGSTLPLDKEAIRDNALTLAKLGKIDPLTLYEDLSMDNPEHRAERFLRSEIDLYTYMQSVEQGMDNNDAEIDIMLLVANRVPSERDAYDEGYLNYFNHFMTSNRYAKLPMDAKQRVVAFLQDVSSKAQQSASLQETMLNDAGIINRPPIFPLPKRTMNIRLQGQMNPQQTQQIAGQEGQMFTPVTGAEQAQSPAAQQGGGATPLQGTPQ